MAIIGIQSLAINTDGHKIKCCDKREFKWELGK
jgi:hypothetical protein